MMMPRARQGSRGQSVLEYTVFMSVVIAALISMSVYIRRATQASMKTMEVQINESAIRP